MFAGTVITGAEALLTVTVNDVELLFPFASVAVQVTVVVPIGNVEPDAGTQLTASVPSTTSVAVGLV
jgi:Ca2+/Na+ antiporter